ncbi:hypothetical protein D3C72_2190590 [compost metagenome]
MPTGSIQIQHIAIRARAKKSTPPEATTLATCAQRGPSLSVTMVTAKSRRSRVMAEAPMKVSQTTV